MAMDLSPVVHIHSWYDSTLFIDPESGIQWGEVRVLLYRDGALTKLPFHKTLFAPYGTALTTHQAFHYWPWQAFPSNVIGYELTHAPAIQETETL